MDFSWTKPLDLVNIYFANVIDGGARGRDGCSPDALREDIHQTCETISRKIQTGSFSFTQYRQKLMPKGAGRRPRVISIPTARDRIVLKAMANLLNETFPEVVPQLAQKKVEAIRLALSEREFYGFVRGDVQEFYPSIRHDHVMVALAERIDNPVTLKLFEDALTTPTVEDGGARQPSSSLGIPQGLAISNMLAEIAMISIDESMRAQAGMEYFRYVDDVLILTETLDSTESAERSLAGLLADADLSLNEYKSGVGRLDESFDYLGYRFSNGKLSVRSSNIKTLEESLARLFTTYKYESRKGNSSRALRRCIFFVNQRITGCISDKVARGWLHYFRQMDDEDLINKLDWVLSRLRRRFDLPADANFKTFTKAYWAVKRPGSGRVGYIPNYDTWDIETRRAHLIDIEGISSVNEFVDEEVNRRFDKLIRASVKDLERDIGSLY